MSFRTPETFRTPELPTSRVSTARRGSDRTARSVTVREEEFDDFFLLDQTFDNPEEYIKRFLEIGDYESAVYWIDNVYSKGNEREAHRDPIKFAKYIKLLVSAQQWLRVSSTLESGDKFHTRHVLFAYFYVRSLFERKMYTQVASAQIGHLIDVANTPIRPAVVINGVEVYLTGYEAPITSEQRRELDAMAEKLAVRSAILLVLGQTFIVLENRQAAAKCLKRALVKDPCCLKAEQLLLQYKLLEVRDEQALHELSSKREPETSEKDPRILTERAKTHYARGDPKAAIQITTDILRHFGWYKDCLIVHINSLSLLEDSDALFTFSHHIVDAMPECEIAWYSVALYYLACKNKAQAKAFMNKSTVMTPGFGDGWLALGHILASDSDNDQALSCYYRAARIMEKNFEPSLYIAMQCSKSGVKLAKSFLEDAARLAPQNPIIYQEQACLAYNDKGFRVALQLYEKALKLVIVGEDLNKLKDLTLDPHEYIARKMYPSDVFWAPLLNNLGHCCRRLQLLEKAKIYHQAALLLQPNNPQALCSSSMVLFAAGDNCGAVQQINKALSIQPFDEIIRENNDLIMNLSTKYNRPKIDRVDGELISPDEFEDLFKTAMLTRPKTPLRFHNQKATRILDEANQILRKPKSFAPVMTPPQVTRVYGRSVRGLPPLPQLGNTPRNPESSAR